MEKSYNDNWIYSPIGQDILRILSDLGKYDDEKPAWSNTLCIEFAKRAYEMGKEDGRLDGLKEAGADCDWECP